MADEVVEDTVVIDAETVEQTGELSPETGNEEVTENFFGDYATKEDFEKGQAAKQALFDKQANELGSLRKEIDIVKANADQASAIKELVETLKPKEPATDWNAVEAGWKEEYGEDVAKAMSATLKTANGWIASDSEKIKTEMQGELESIKGELKAEREARFRLTPAYQANQELADSFIEKGMSTKDAIEMASSINQKIAPSAPERGTLPSSVGGSRVVAQEPAKVTYYSEAEKIALKEGPDPLTDEEINKIEADYAARVEAGRR